MDGLEGVEGGVGVKGVEGVVGVEGLVGVEGIEVRKDENQNEKQNQQRNQHPYEEKDEPTYEHEDLKAQEKAGDLKIQECKTEGKTEDDGEEGISVIESLCVRCEENGETRIMLSSIPYFQNIYIAAFNCPHCGYRNNECQSAGGLAERGVRFELRVRAAADLDRQVVKGEHACVRVPSLDFEIPSNTQRGQVSTLQGILSQAVESLQASQPLRRAADPEMAARVETTVSRLSKLIGKPVEESEKEKEEREGEKGEWDFVLEDPSGNSYIENLCAPRADPQLKVEHYQRTEEQRRAMGFLVEADADQPGTGAEGTMDNPISGDANGTSASGTGTGTGPGSDTNLRGALNLPTSLTSNENWLETREVMKFESACSRCGNLGSQNMCEIDIPGFRRCIVMAFVCDSCGYKNSEVKPASGFGEKARRMELVIESMADLSRDVLKADSAAVLIPALELELLPGTLGGVFTTVEGLLMKIAEELFDKFPFVGDSAEAERRDKLTRLLQSLRDAAAGKNLPLTIVLDDGADQSHIGRRDDDVLFYTGAKPRRNLSHSDDAGEEEGAEDKQLTVTLYTRTKEQEDDLGITNMRTEEY